MSGPPVLPTELVLDDLVVRTYRSSDARRLVDTVTENRAHLEPWMPWIAYEPQTVAERVDWIEGCERDRLAGGDTTYGIFLRDSLVGGSGFHRRDGPDVLEIGYWVAASHGRRGIARRVAEALTSRAFEVPGIEWIDIRHDRRNVNSGRIPERLGFHLVEEYRRRPEAPGESGLLHRWRVGRSEWLARR